MVDDLYRQSASCVLGALSALVDSQPFSQVIGDAGVERSVGATEDIDVPGLHSPMIHPGVQNGPRRTVNKRLAPGGNCGPMKRANVGSDVLSGTRLLSSNATSFAYPSQMRCADFRKGDMIEPRTIVSAQKSAFNSDALEIKGPDHV